MCRPIFEWGSASRGSIVKLWPAARWVLLGCLLCSCSGCFPFIKIKHFNSDAAVSEPAKVADASEKPRKDEAERPAMLLACP